MKISTWCLCTLLLEGAGLASFLGEGSATSGLGLFLFFRALASLLLAAFLHDALPERYRRTPVWGHIFFFVVAFFIPYVGTLGLSGSVYFAYYTPRVRPLRRHQLNDVPALPHKPFPRNLQLTYGEGALLGILHHSPDPERRRKAVLAARNLPDKEAIAILRAAMRDPVDDVRLLAYGLLDQRELVLNREIKRVLSRIKKTPNENDPYLHSLLARYYWEIAYLGLAQGEIRIHILKTAEDHAERAIVPGKDDGSVRLLLGRICLELGNTNKARSQLVRALRLGLPDVKVLPYLAETHFKNRDFAQVQHCFNRLGIRARHNHVLMELAEFWS